MHISLLTKSIVLLEKVQIHPDMTVYQQSLLIMQIQNRCISVLNFCGIQHGARAALLVNGRKSSCST